MTGFRGLRFICLLAVCITVTAIQLASSTQARAEVFYCSSDEGTGFAPSEDYKMYSYPEQRFQVQVDFLNEAMRSDKIYLKGNVECVTDSSSGTLYCISDYGTSLAVNPDSLKFHLSSMFLLQTTRDDMVLTHGSCETF
nr:hypothetical protein 10 [Alphaproteobacteria bacterium]